MDENVSKGFHLGGTIMAAMAVIAVAITAVVLGISIARRGSAEATTMTNDLADQKYTQYDNKTVNGDTILSLIKQYENSDISIVVENGNGAITFIRESDGASQDGEATLGEKLDHATQVEAFRNASDKTSDGYISPNRNFSCVVCRNPSTEAITAMYFYIVDEE